MVTSLRNRWDQQKLVNLPGRDLIPKLKGMIRRFTLGKSTQTAGDTTRCNGTTFGDSATEGENLQQYGLASSPPPGSEGVYLKQIGAMICVDSRGNRPALASGEVAIYCEHGQLIYLKEDGSIVLTAKSGQDVSISVGEPLGSFLTELHGALTAWSPVLNDGGGALKTALADLLLMTPPGKAP